LRTFEVLLERKKIKFATLVVLIKCLEQIKLPILHYKCAPISELPPKIGTMHVGFFLFSVANILSVKPAVEAGVGGVPDRGRGAVVPEECKILRSFH